MQMLFFRPVLLVLALFIFGGFTNLQPALGSVDTLELSAVGAINFSTPRVGANNTGISASGRTVFGFGGLAAFPILPLVKLESGVLYLPQSYTNSGVDFTLTELDVPILLQWTLLPFLTVGAGAYLGFGVGSITTTDNSKNPAVTTNASFDNANYSRFDLGAMLSAAVTLPVHPGLGVLVDLRYLFGIKNLNSTAGNSFQSGGFFVLAGLKLDL